MIKLMNSLANCAFAPQPNQLVKPTPTSSACGCPPRVALRRGLPRALSVMNGEPHQVLQENKLLVSAFVDAINAQDWSRVLALVASDFARHSTAAGEPGVRSAEDLVAFLKAEFATFPDATETLLDLVAEGNKVAARHQFHGTQLGPMGLFPPSGKVLNASYIAIYRIENQRIAEAWAEWDNLAGLKQLGYANEA